MMTFGGIKATQFGCTKVTLISDRFTAQMEYETITRAGVHMATIAVPTVREIEVELLVRAPKIKELYKLIEKIGKWLTEPGEAKLELRHTSGKYYKARCKGIEPPSFSGITARLKVTFVCSDYRLYNLYNDKPVSGADPKADNFTFNGKHCLNDMHCMFVLTSKTAVPQISPFKYEVSGRTGTVRYDDDSLILSEGAIRGTLYFVNQVQDGEMLAFEDAEERMHEVASWLACAGRAEFIWDSDVTRVYQAEVEKESLFDREKWSNGKIGITMTIQPLAMDKSAASVTKALSLAAGAATQMDISAALPRGAGYETPLVVSIKNTGSSAITDLSIYYTDMTGTEQQMRFYGGGFSLSAGQTLTVDGEDISSFVGSTNAGKWLYAGDYPRVKPGAFTIKLKTAAASSVSVTVTARARWI